MISRAPGNAVSTTGLNTEEERDPGLPRTDNLCVGRAICDVELYAGETGEPGTGPQTMHRSRHPDVIPQTDAVFPKADTVRCCPDLSGSCTDTSFSLQAPAL